MAIPVVQSYTKNNNTGSPITLTKPSGVSVGDLLIIVVANEDNTNTDQWDDSTYKPTGFTLINEAGDSSADAHVAAFYRVADGTETSTIDVPMQNSCDCVGFYIRVTLVDTSDVVNQVHADQTNSGSSFTVSEVTTDAADCLAFAVLGFDGGDGYSFSFSGTGWSKVDEEQVNTSGNTSSGCWGTKDVSGAGGTGDCTINASASDGAAFFQFAMNGASGPVISGCSSFSDKETGVIATGSNFGSSQGSGKVEIGDSSTYATANKVEQTVTSWGDSSITFTGNLGTQSPGTKWLFVTDDSSNVSTGYAVHVYRAVAWQMSDSSYITASGENTGARLTAPTGKSGDFTAGRIQDDENPADAVDIASDYYTEMEWCIKALTNARNVQYDFQVRINGVAIDSYTITPHITVTSGWSGSVSGISSPTEIDGSSFSEIDGV